MLQQFASARAIPLFARPSALPVCNPSVLPKFGVMDPVAVFAASPQELLAARHALETGALRTNLQSQGSDLEFREQHRTSGNNGSAFYAPDFFSNLKTRALGRVLLTSRATTSTQSLLQDSLRSLPDGVVFVADKQVQGKGRGGNVWESPAGCLMVSAAMRLTISGQRLPFLQYLVSMAVVQAVREEAARCLQGGAGLEVRLKWPNDIYAGEYKIGGVLCHSAYRDRAFHLVWGLGLNVGNRAPTTCLDRLFEEAAVARSLPAPPPARPERLLASLLGWLEPAVDGLAQHGFQPFQPGYLRAWLHSGQRVELEEAGSRVALTIEGLTPDGYLLARDDAGLAYELHPDGNSLDFFRGLVRKKLPAAS
uniref:BPL/LPL catalytic domain-containing protein n=1 Tax=Auxenochlorella protothecoides TaxID=3075 RepID=A0A1D2AED9_AUXPR